MDAAKNIEITEVNVPPLCETVWKIQVSHRPLEKVNAEILELVEAVLSTGPLDSADLTSFAEASYKSFGESSSQWRLLFLQMLITLPGNALLAPLRSRLTPSNAAIIAFNVQIVLALVSTISVCCKGGTALISDLLHELLIQIFSTTSEDDNTASSPPDLAVLLDDTFSSSSSTSSAPNSPSTLVDPVEWRFCQFRHALLFARQLSAEDPRITAFSYAQWWRSQFSARPNQAGVLVTRRSLHSLATHLLHLLPHETSAVHLHTQLTAEPPFWLAASDSEESCFKTWRDYLDVGRGRLAELRMEQSGALSRTDTRPAPVSAEWSMEVAALVDEFAKGMSESSATSATPKLPTAIVEMHLFRGQHLRDVVIPMLRSPPPTLPADRRAACATLVRCIEAHLGGGAPSAERRPRNVRFAKCGRRNARVRK